MKSDLRKIFLAKRLNLSNKDIKTQSTLICDKLINYLKTLHKEPKVVHTFLPIIKYKEVNTYALISVLREKFKSQIVVPKMKSGKLISCKLTSDLKINKFGIPEPSLESIVEPDEINFVIVPLLVCDKHLNRIGYGGGYYDRFLSTLPQSTIKIGVGFYEPIETQIKTHSGDVKLDKYITPQKIY